MAVADGRMVGQSCWEGKADRSIPSPYQEGAQFILRNVQLRRRRRVLGDSTVGINHKYRAVRMVIYPEPWRRNMGDQVFVIDKAVHRAVFRHFVQAQAEVLIAD